LRRPTATVIRLLRDYTQQSAFGSVLLIFLQTM
jgi:hypothetical protein